MFSIRVRSTGHDSWHDIEAISAEHAIRQLLEDVDSPGPWRFEFLLAVPTPHPDGQAGQQPVPLGRR
ncbi:hypothetical protein WCD74_08395 [Actinomycetospora sp. OC33-EN08]|uniref:Uncharacterized protein n=1 Tax=Actinomycetospora aurantiaca TaxID=3129233 RepID=A0ABU8MM63_9PSEU